MLSLLARIRSLLRALRRGDALNDDMGAEFRLHMVCAPGPASPLFQVVGGVVIFAVLAIRVPNAVASRLSGGSSFGIANALRATS